MDKQPSSRAPLIIAIVLFLLPVMYVWCYLALVIPGQEGWQKIDGIDMPYRHPYRLGESVASTVFWPLEQIDRKARPGAWDSPVDQPVLDP
jgi:hypothetical protein